MNSEGPNAILKSEQIGSDDPHADMPPGPSSVLPRLSRRVIWAEVMAVLAIGVIPHLSSALMWSNAAAEERPLRLPPYWLDALDLSVRSCCVIFPVLFLIYRSRERFAYFGLVQPRRIDLLLGVCLLVYSQLAWRVVYGIFQPADQAERTLFPPPIDAGDYFLMTMKYSANAFAEELVTRAYLITRFQFLLKSKSKAVVVAAMLFGAYHIYGGVTHAIYSFALAMVLGAIFLSTRRIWPGIIGHFLIDVRSDLSITV